MRKLLSIFILSSIMSHVSAQEIILKGKVCEIYDGKEAPLVYATVTNKNTSEKVTAGIWGDYSIRCNQGDTVKVTYIGYETLNWIVENDTAIQKNFYLEMIENPLEYIQPKESKINE